MKISILKTMKETEETPEIFLASQDALEVMLGMHPCNLLQNQMGIARIAIAPPPLGVGDVHFS